MADNSFNNFANEQGEFALPKLNYGYDAVEECVDAQTMELHYTKHHQTYVTNLNGAVKQHPELAKMSVEEILLNFDKVPDSIKGVIRNHGGGHANHCLYWSILTSANKTGNPSKDLLAQIDKYFGNYDNFKAKLTDCCVKTFGSGWGWVSVNPQGELVIESTPNQDSPLMKGNMPILGIDVWEHAYYLKYQNKRPEYVQNIFKVINWENVSDRFNEIIKVSSR